MRKHSKKEIKNRVAFVTGAAMLLCVFFFLPVSAKKTVNLNKFMSDRVAMALSKMIGTSELIVYGKVETVSDSSFIFRVSKRLSGTCKNEPINVLKITPDKFASIQPPPYEKGQCLILFLNQPKDSQKNPLWKVIGFGGEGQMPVENGYVYFQGNNISGLQFDEYPLNRTKQYIQRFELLSFLNAVEEYGKCFKWSRSIAANLLIPQKICPDAQIAEYSQKSFIHNYLTVQTQSIISQK